MWLPLFVISSTALVWLLYGHHAGISVLICHSLWMIHYHLRIQPDLRDIREKVSVLVERKNKRAVARNKTLRSTHE